MMLAVPGTASVSVSAHVLGSPPPWRHHQPSFSCSPPSHIAAPPRPMRCVRISAAAMLRDDAYAPGPLLADGRLSPETPGQSNPPTVFVNRSGLRLGEFKLWMCWLPKCIRLRRFIGCPDPALLPPPARPRGLANHSFSLLALKPSLPLSFCVVSMSLCRSRSLSCLLVQISFPTTIC